MAARYPQINYRLEFESDFHIGSGLGTSSTDDATARDSFGHIYIPSSTIKGVVRDGVEHVVRALWPDEARRERAVFDIFESSALGPRWHFSDARPIYWDFSLRQSEGDVSLALIDSERVQSARVSIDYSLGRAAEKKLFFLEDGNSSLEMAGHIRCVVPWNGDDADQEQQVLLLKAGLLWARSLGHGRRRGAGACLFKLEETEGIAEGLKAVSSSQ